MAVESALTHALNLWKGISPKQYPNGAVVFCSEDVAEILHLPTPLKRLIYDCGRQFKVSVLQDAIDTQLGPVYGVIVVDGSDAAFGKAQGLSSSLTSGPVVAELGCMGAHIAGRTRRGGQSALRYSRLRDESEQAFLRKVAERANMLFGDVHGVILGGKADMKQKLLQELPAPLRQQVKSIVDISHDAGPEALRHVALCAAEDVSSSENSGADRLLSSFFECAFKGSMCCYGEMQTVRALQMGAVEHLLMAADLETGLDADGWKSLAASYGTHIVKIHPRSEQGVKFCQSFGVGGCLRWPVEWELLEEAAGPDEEEALGKTFGVNSELQKSSESAEVLQESTLGPSGSWPRESLHESTLNATETHENNAKGASAELIAAPNATDTTSISDVTQHRRETLEWFEAELQDVLDDPSSAQALTVCLDVLLSDEVTGRDEISENVLAIVAAEGVPAELASELMRRW